MQTLDKRELALLSEKFSGSELEKAIKRAEGGEPLAYVLGQWYFYGLTFKLNSDCLIPRPDTEHVVDKAISLIPKNGTFADLCTGSGCIAISLKKHRRDLTGYALDISSGALEMAKINARENGTPLSFIEADVLKSNPQTLFTPLDAVISNPPYIRTEVLRTLEVAKTEPHRALDGGEDGMIFYRHIVKEYAPMLKPNGLFIFEIGYDQASQITAIAKENGFTCSVYKDYGGCDRVAVMKASAQTEKHQI